MTDDIAIDPRAARTSEAEDRALEALNAASGTDELASILKASGVDADPARILEARGTGFFPSLEAASEAGLDRNGIAALVAHFDRPIFETPGEVLEKVLWVHGAELRVARPEAFASVTHGSGGLRLVGRTFERDVPFVPPFSDVMATFDTPTLEGGKRYRARAFIVNMRSDPIPYGIQGQPIATPYQYEVRDGHRFLAADRFPYLDLSVNRYVRVPLPSTGSLLYGLSIRLESYVFRSSPDRPPFILEIAAVGVELVSGGRGDVFAPPG